MNYKDKAKQLVDKYFDEVFNGSNKIQDYYEYDKSKQCAIIACDEIIKHCAFYNHETKMNFEECSGYSDNYFSTYWQNVKQAINEL